MTHSWQAQPIAAADWNCPSSIFLSWLSSRRSGCDHFKTPTGESFLRFALRWEACRCQSTKRLAWPPPTLRGVREAGGVGVGVGCGCGYTTFNKPLSPADKFPPLPRLAVKIAFLCLRAVLGTVPPHNQLLSTLLSSETDSHSATGQQTLKEVLDKANK